MRDSETGTHGADVEHESDAVFKRVASVVFASVVVLYVAARLWRLTASCLWFDEIFSVHAARHDWAGMLRFVAADLIHPPLFYVLLKIWMILGGASLLWLRLFPALTAIACLAPFVLLCRELKLGAHRTNLALLLLAVNGYLIKYAQEVRMYSLLLLFTLLSLWLFFRFVNARDEARGNRKLLTALFVVNLLLVYTHYYGWLVVSTQVAFLLFFARRKLLSFSVVAAALALAYAPWIYAVWRAARESQGLQQNLGWMTRPRLSDIAQFFVLLNEPFYFRQSSTEMLYARLSAPLGLLLFGVPVALLLWRELRGRRIDERDARENIEAGGASFGETDATFREARTRRLTMRLLLFSLLPLVAAFILSWMLPQSVWGTRHLIIVAAPYTILAAVALTALRPFRLQAAALVILCGWFSLAGLFMLLRREGTYIWCTWEGLAGQLRQHARETGEPAQVYAFEDLVAYHLWFALDSEGEKNFKVVAVKRVPGMTEDPAYFLPRAFEEVATRDISGAFAEESFWVAFRDRELSEQRPPLSILKERGYRIHWILEDRAQGQRAFIIQLRR